MAWYWEYGKEEIQHGLHPVTATHHQPADTMEFDMNVAADRSPADGSSKEMRFVCEIQTGSSDMPIEMSPSSKRSIHKLSCLEMPSTADSMPDDSTGETCPLMDPHISCKIIECDPEALCEPPSGAEEMTHDDWSIFTVNDTEGCSYKRQRVLPLNRP